MEEKIQNLLEEITKREDKAFDQQNFCREHNFNLEAANFKTIEDTLRSVRRLIEKELL
jgi:hypothetical protein